MAGWGGCGSGDCCFVPCTTCTVINRISGIDRGVVGLEQSIFPESAVLVSASSRRGLILEDGLDVALRHVVKSTPCTLLRDRYECLHEWMRDVYETGNNSTILPEPYKDSQSHFHGSDDDSLIHAICAPTPRASRSVRTSYLVISELGVKGVRDSERCACL